MDLFFPWIKQKNSETIVLYDKSNTVMGMRIDRLNY